MSHKRPQEEVPVPSCLVITVIYRRGSNLMNNNSLGANFTSIRRSAQARWRNTGISAVTS